MGRLWWKPGAVLRYPRAVVRRRLRGKEKVRYGLLLSLLSESPIQNGVNDCRLLQDSASCTGWARSAPKPRRFRPLIRLPASNPESDVFSEVFTRSPVGLNQWRQLARLSITPPVARLSRPAARRAATSPVAAAQGGCERATRATRSPIPHRSNRLDGASSCAYAPHG